MLSAAPLAVALLMAGGCTTSPTHQQPAYEACNGDVLVGDCKLEMTSEVRGSWIQSSEHQCAAAQWARGMSRRDGTLKNKVNITRVITPEGEQVSTSEYAPIATDITDGFCFHVKAITHPSERPPIIPDAEDPLTLKCKDNPPQLFDLAPQLARSAVVTIDPNTRKMIFFGRPLDMTDHFGSAYSGISTGFAAAIHKTEGTYSVLLPGGIVLSGRCDMPVDKASA